jgi:VWFA-related protein
VLRHAACAVACGAVLLTSNATPSAAVQRPPQFRAGVDLVQVDVSVLDAVRRPIRGLTAADFTIFEDGVPQAVAAFTEFHVPDAVEPPARWMTEHPPDVATNTGGDGRLMVIVLDDATAPADGGKALAEAFQTAARRIIERIGPSDRVALIFTMDNRAAQDFTNDRQRLLRALPSFSPKFMPDIPTPSIFARTSTVVVSKVSQHLQEITGRRKSVIFVSVDPQLNMNLRPESTTEVRSGAYAVMLLKAIASLEKAQQSNITAYSINPRSTLGVSRTLGEALGDGGDDDGEIARLFDRPGSSGSFMQRLAAETGGITIARPGALGSGITQIFRESGSYYLLGYQPVRDQSLKGFRKLEVMVNRPGVMVRARNGYYPRLPDEAGSRRNPPSPLALANAGLLPARDLPLEVSVAPFAIPGKSEVAVTVIAGLTSPPPAAATVEDVSLLVQAFTPHGDARGSVRRDSRVTLVSSPLEARYELRVRIDLKPGRYELRVAAESRTQAKAGSVYVSVDVPDFSKPPIALSGAVLTLSPAVAAPHSAEIGAILPVFPTARRDVAGRTATAFVRLYQGGRKTLAPVELRTRILDSADRVVFEGTETLAPDRFGAGRAADHLWPLPADLPAGEFVLLFDATAGTAAATRSLRFLRSPPGNVSRVHD